MRMEDSPTAGPATDLSSVMQQAKALLAQSRPAEALLVTGPLAARHPGNRDVLYLHAVAQRLSNRIPAALESLLQLEAMHPQYPRLHQERGNCYVTVGEVRPAILAFERAVKLNPSLPASWNMLETLYAKAGKPEASARAAGMLRQLNQLPGEIVTAFSMYADGEAEEAEKLIRHYIQLRGHHVEALRLLAKIALDLEIADDASTLLEYVLKAAPEHHVARHEYALVLTRQYRHAEAMEHARCLLAAQPDHPAYRLLHATLLSTLGEFEAAIGEFRELIALNPGDADLHLALGNALQIHGDREGAIGSYRHAIELRPRLGDPYWSLANLKTYQFDADELARMRSVESAPGLPVRDRIHFCFALGKALEDQGEYAGAFQSYARGNALKRSSLRYRPEAIERMAGLQSAVCTKAFFEARHEWGCPQADPIFIVGLPRSGSTLVEQILASHSKVDGTMELANVLRLVGQLQDRTDTDAPPRYPGILAELSAQDFRGFGEGYIADTQVYRHGKPHFIDKMPNNFRHIGLIHLMLPNARIIDVRREPMACCFGIYKQLFASGQQFAYSFEDLARYYRSYVDLMRHWDNVLPGRVLRVQYERLVDDLAGEVRRLLAHCELEMEPECLEFHKNARPVHTVSAQQVRQPINREGLEQWRNYEPWLAPLRELLGNST
jgi:tetratricopeptide (TPR) repeat protein